MTDTINDRAIEGLEALAADKSNLILHVDASFVLIMTRAYRERDRLRKELDDLKSGDAIVKPTSVQHAANMMTIGQDYMSENFDF